MGSSSKRQTTMAKMARERALQEKRVEMEALRRDGTELPVELSVSAVQQEGTWRINAVLSDITERRRAERELLRRERLLSYAQRAARMGTWEWDVARDEITWSVELHRIFETDPHSFDPTLEGYEPEVVQTRRRRQQRVTGTDVRQRLAAPD